MNLQPITHAALKALRRDMCDMILCEGATPEQINTLRFEVLKTFEAAATDARGDIKQLTPKEHAV